MYVGLHRASTEPAAPSLTPAAAASPAAPAVLETAEALAPDGAGTEAHVEGAADELEGASTGNADNEVESPVAVRRRCRADAGSI